MYGHKIIIYLYFLIKNPNMSISDFGTEPTKYVFLGDSFKPPKLCEWMAS